MTQDDLNNSHSEAFLQTINCVQTVDGVTTEWDLVSISGDGVEKSLWDAALASADDALVLVQWLESKRNN